MKRFAGTATVLMALVAFVLPTGAAAHEGNPDYRSEIVTVTPASAAEGLVLTIQNFDDNVELNNRTGKVVMVEGYDGEAYIRAGADGDVDVNLNSPSYYLNEDRFADVTVPDRADAKAEPDWKQVADNGIYSWHDHRSHYMGLGTPSQVKDESQETEVFAYVIPMTVGGVPVEANGILTWVGKQSGFPVVPFIGLAAVIVLGAIGISIARRRRNEDDNDSGTGSSGPEPSGDSTEAW
ncbi:MAG: hypothetical protein WBP55_11460 [Solirubrobacterales bacterium]